LVFGPKCSGKHNQKTILKLTNTSTPVTHLLATHLPSHIDAFHPIVTREFRPPKPSPAGILHIAKAWGVESAQQQQHSLPLIMVGDSIDDIIAGYDAGALTVLVKSLGKEDLERDERTHVVVERLDELVGLLEGGIEAR
jgi:phosphoglycolate phosphatase-like HAD superfamily hydrolase